MGNATNTLYVVIDATGAQSGAATVNAQLNSINYTANTVNNTLINMSNTSGKSTSQMAGHFSSLSRFFKSFQRDLSGISGLIAAFQPMNMFRSFIDELIKVNREYSSFIAMMNVTTGDVVKSGEAYDYVKGAAMSYGVAIHGLMKGYSQLTAATKGLMSEIDMKKLFESVTAVTTIMHSTPQTVERIFNSLIQMASKGKVSMEELRQQFGEHVPGALQIGAAAMGMTMDKFMTKVAKGGITAIDFLSRLPDELNKRFGEAAIIASKSLNAAKERLKTVVFDLFKEMSTNSMALGLGAIFDSISKKVTDSSPAFVTFSEIVGQAFLKVAKFIEGISSDDIIKFTNGVINAANAFVSFVSTGISVIEFIRKYSDETILLIEMLILLRVGVIGLIIPLTGAAAAMTAAGGASAVLGRGLLVIQGILGALAAFAAGWAFGTYLKEKFEFVEQAGRIMVNHLVQSVEKLAYTFNMLKVIIPAAFGAAFEGAANNINMFLVSLRNLGASVLNTLGMDIDKIKPMQFDFTSGYKKEMIKLTAEHTKQMKVYDQVNEDMKKDITAKHAAKLKAATPDSKSVAEQMGLTQARVKNAMERYQELQAMGTTPGKYNSDAATGASGKGKKQRSTLVKDITSDLTEVKDAYTQFTEGLKNLVEDGSVTINQAFTAQVAALQKYTEAEKAIVTRGLADTKDPEQIKTLNAKILGIESDYQVAMTKLVRENTKQRRDEQKAADDAMIESGALKLSEEAKFLRKWEQNEGKMAVNARSGGDTDTANKFDIAKQAEIDKLRKTDKKTVDSFFATSDEAWLMDVTEKYEKMRELIQNSSAFTLEQQAQLIAKLDSQMEFMTPTIRNIESVVTGSFDKMAESLIKFTKTGKLNFGSLISSMIEDMVKLELKSDMSAIWKNLGGLSGILGGGSSSSSSDSSGIFGGLLSGISGLFGGGPASGTGAGTAAVGSLFGAVSGSRALGGPVLQGKTYNVGENGPERFTPSSSGQITPNKSSSTTINIHVPVGSPAEMRRSIGAGARDVVNAFNNASRYR